MYHKLVQIGYFEEKAAGWACGGEGGEAPYVRGQRAPSNERVVARVGKHRMCGVKELQVMSVFRSRRRPFPALLCPDASAKVLMKPQERSLRRLPPLLRPCAKPLGQMLGKMRHDESGRGL